MLNALWAPVGALRRRPDVTGWRQFLLLAALTGFTGSVIGLERPILPLIGSRQFHLVSHVAILSFIVSFGVAKATANLLAGRLADRFGRRRVLLAGWLLGLAEPVLIILAPSWTWIVAANLLLGLQQGLCWTTLINMMIDRTRPANRGFAAGINEFSGYMGVALATLLSGYLAARYGLRPVPFLPSLAFIAVGASLTVGAVDETERPRSGSAWRPIVDVAALPLLAVARNRLLLVCSQAGLVTNFLDSMVWGLLPLYLYAHGLRIEQIGAVVGVYPLAWGLGQAVSGPLSDRLGRRLPITLGLAGQGIAIAGFLVLTGFSRWLAVAIVVGLFRALAYPTLLAAAADSAREDWRASALGVYRFYRDAGFVLGGLAGGLVADLIGIPSAIALAAGFAIVSAGVSARFIGARLEAREHWSRVAQGAGPAP